MHRYAPTSENHTENYVTFLERETGVTRDTILKDIQTQPVGTCHSKI
jgi:hypothetical protein